MNFLMQVLVKIFALCACKLNEGNVGRLHTRNPVHSKARDASPSNA